MFSRMGFLLLVVITILSCNNKAEHAATENVSIPKNSNDSVMTKTGYSDVNGIKMYYEFHGDKGETLVLIHGGGSTIETTFGFILPMLAKNYKVLAVELQAHGRTSDRNAPESFEQDADDVSALLKNLNISKASFFGFSNGGNTTMQIGIRHPEIVNKLIVASAFYKRSAMMPGFFEGLKKATLKDMPADLQKGFLKVNPDSSKLLNMFNKDRLRMVNFKDWPDELLASIKAPTLIINGDQDVASSTHAAIMAGLIKNSRLLILPATHGSYLGEIEAYDKKSKLPELTLIVIDEFLRTP